MKVCVYGAGAIGGNLAVQLMSLPAIEVSVVARGAHLDAIRARGLKLVTPSEERVAFPAAATDNPEELPPQDIVFITLKAHALVAIGPRIARLLKPDGHAVFVTNGLPWWWHHGLPGVPRNMALVDPDSSLWTGLGASRSLGCTVYSMNEVTGPGEIYHRGNNSWIMGEPDNQMSGRLEKTVGLLRRAGLAAEASSDIRLNVLTKLLRNAALNPICALTRLDVQQVAGRADLVRLSRCLTEEAANTALAMGWDLSACLETEAQALQNGGAIRGDKVMGTKPSMLQDVLASRPTEVDAILGELQQFARDHGVATPTIDHVYALLKGLDASMRQLA
ncbi:MAG: 2-dehydropantoate 2-reductase [Pseudomonadota bacterium]